MTIKNIFADKPHNPMVNSGAIMSASILLHLVRSEMKIPLKYDYVMEFFKSLAGGEHVGFSNSVKTYYLKFTKTSIIGFANTIVFSAFISNGRLQVIATVIFWTYFPLLQLFMTLLIQYL